VGRQALGKNYLPGKKLRDAMITRNAVKVTFSSLSWRPRFMDAPARLNLAAVDVINA
jgi:hypothetical protein